MIVMAIVVIAGSILVIQMNPARGQANVNTAFNTVMTTLRGARERAITERRNYTVAFNPTGYPTNSMTTTLVDTNAVISSTTLPTGVAFDLESGLPSSPPVAALDGMGGGSSAIAFDVGVSGTPTTTITFMPDGSAVDANFNYNFGIVYIAQPGNKLSSRAVTVIGPTGRIRGWRYSGAYWYTL
jgi:type II secretory pathway pseudopilin PulG